MEIKGYVWFDAVDEWAALREAEKRLNPFGWNGKYGDPVHPDSNLDYSLEVLFAQARGIKLFGNFTSKEAVLDKLFGYHADQGEGSASEWVRGVAIEDYCHSKGGYAYLAKVSEPEWRFNHDPIDTRYPGPQFWVLAGFFRTGTEVFDLEDLKVRV